MILKKEQEPNTAPALFLFKSMGVGLVPVPGGGENGLQVVEPGLPAQNSLDLL